jgi:hypothetical protein
MTIDANSPPTGQPTHSPADAARFKATPLMRGFFVALLLAAAVNLSPNDVDPDIWGHVLYGEEVLAEGALPQTATHTYTAPRHPWVNHENISEIVFALGFRHFGPRGLLIGKCLAGLFVIGLMIAAARAKRVEMAAILVTLVLVTLNLAGFWAVRPQLLSFVSFAIMMALVERAFRHWDQTHRAELAWLIPVPLVIAFWTNSHGGFAAGVCVLGAYLVGRSLEAVYYRGKAAWPQVAALAACGAATVLATLANPYGIGLHRWMIRSLGSPRPEITEWSAPKFGDDFFYPFTLLTIVAVVALAASRRRRDLTQWVVLALVFWQAATHLRHIAFFALLCGYWLPVHIESIFDRLRKGAADAQAKSAAAAASSSASPWPGRVIAVALCATLAVLCVRLTHRLADYPVQRDKYPVDALEYMARQNLSGKLVVSFNWAQYAIAALAPEVDVAFDGRFRTCYPQQVVDMHFDFLIGDVGEHRHRDPASGPIDPARALRFGEPDLVLVDRRFRHSAKVMESDEQRRDWALLYQDALAQVWGRRDKYDRPESPAFIPSPDRRISEAVPTGSVTWPALPPRGRGSVVERPARSILSPGASREAS